jgi:fibronectin type 3 domain-containing protein
MASVTGYRVYYGTASRSYSQALGSGEFVTTSTYIATGLQSGRTYYFAVTAIDAAGAESAFSNEAGKTIP